MKNTSKTFEYIEDLKIKLSASYADYKTVLNYRFDLLKQELLKHEKVDYDWLLNELYGIYPKDFNDFILTISEIFQTKIDYSSRNNSNGKDSLWESQNFPPEQLANYEWRFTDESAEKIVNSINVNNKQIGCFGTPTIALELIKESKAKNTLLFDINKSVLQLIEKSFSKDSGIHCIEYDAVDKVPLAYISKFDVIITNPPWYLDYYLLFVFRSLQLLKKDGEIIIPLFPLLCRENAIRDLDCFFKVIEQWGCYSVSPVGFVDFKMPAFEKKALEESNIIKPIINWRKAELVRLSFNSTISSPIAPKIKDYVKWNSVTTQCGKLFLFNESTLDNMSSRSEIIKEHVCDISRSVRRTQNIMLWDVVDNAFFRVRGLEERK